MLFGVEHQTSNLFAPFFAVPKSGFWIEALFSSQIRFHFTWKQVAHSTMIQFFAFATGFDLAYASPKWFFHIQAAFAAYFLFSLAIVAVYTAS